MNQKFTNPCTRCGKDRIDARTWTEEVSNFFGASTVTYTDTVCPDPECQKIVEEKLAVQRAHTANLQAEREKRMQAQNRNRKKKVPPAA